LIFILISSLNLTNKAYIDNVSFINDKNETVFQSNYFFDFPVSESLQITLDPSRETQNPVPLEDLPKEFSWTNFEGKDWTTPAKNQGYCGSCWAFGALGVFESMIKIREKNADLNPDLSEQYILSCLSSAGSCYGGSALRAFQYIYETTAKGNYHNGVVLESCMEYEANDDIPCSDKCGNWEDLLVPLLNYGYYKPDGSSSFRDVIKTHILQNGPVVAHMQATKFFKLFGALVHNPNAYYPKFRPTIGLNHVVMIVGWKDSPLIPSGGYWICKNSWGKDWGYNGFFNIAYGSLSIDKYQVIWADYDPESFNWKPYADTGGPYGAIVGQQVFFNASKSIGYEGEIIDYSWDFGDGNFGNGVVTSHIYNQTGVFIITLNVTDVKNSSTIANSKVWVQESNSKPKTPTINGLNTGEFWKEYIYKIYSEDPDGNELLYYIDWGDGKKEEWIGPFASGLEITVSHTWVSIGSFNVKVKVKDPFNEESDWATLKVKMPRSRVFSLNLLYFTKDLFENWFNLLILIIFF
jgi:C1A family cysteine protease